MKVKIKVAKFGLELGIINFKLGKPYNGMLESEYSYK